MFQTATGEPVANLYLQLKWDLIAYETHRYRIKATKACVDSQAPRTFMHMYIKPKKLQAELERLCTIQRANKSLLEKMAQLHRDGCWTDHRNYHEIKSLNAWHRQKEMLELAYNNQIMMSRVLDVHATYDRSRQEDEYLINQKYKSQVTRYPKNWRDILKQTMRMRTYIRTRVVMPMHKKFKVEKAKKRLPPREASIQEELSEEEARAERLKKNAERRRLAAELKARQVERKKQAAERKKEAEEKEKMEAEERRKRDKMRFERRKEENDKLMDEYKKKMAIQRELKDEEDRIRAEQERVEELKKQRLIRQKREKWRREKLARERRGHGQQEGVEEGDLGRPELEEVGSEPSAEGSSGFEADKDSDQPSSDAGDKEEELADGVAEEAGVTDVDEGEVEEQLPEDEAKAEGTSASGGASDEGEASVDEELVGESRTTSLVAADRSAEDGSEATLEEEGGSASDEKEEAGPSDASVVESEKTAGADQSTAEDEEAGLSDVGVIESEKTAGTDQSAAEDEEAGLSDVGVVESSKSEDEEAEKKEG